MNSTLINEKEVGLFLPECDNDTMRYLIRVLETENILERNSNNKLIFSTELLQNFVDSMDLQKRNIHVENIAKICEKLQEDNIEFLKYAAHFYSLNNNSTKMFQLLCEYIDKQMWLKVDKREVFDNLQLMLRHTSNTSFLKNQISCDSRNVERLKIQYYINTGNIISHQDLKNLEIKKNKNVLFALQRNYVCRNDEVTAYKVLQQEKENLSESQFDYYLALTLSFVTQNHTEIKSFLQQQFTEHGQDAYQSNLLKSKIYRKRQDYHLAINAVLMNMVHFAEDTRDLLFQNLKLFIDNANAGQEVHNSREKLCNFSINLFQMIITRFGKNYELAKYQSALNTLCQMSALLINTTNTGKQYHFQKMALDFLEKKQYQKHNKYLIYSLLELIEIFIDGKKTLHNEFSEIYDGISIVLQIIRNTKSNRKAHPDIYYKVYLCEAKLLRLQGEIELSDNFFEKSIECIPLQNKTLRDEVLKEWNIF